MLGASLWIFGALLWAYLVMGEWVLQLSLPESVAILVVILAYGIAWFTSGRGLITGAGRWKVVVPGIAAVVLFVMTLLVVAGLFGSSRRSTVAAVTISLWFFSASMYVLGRHLRARPRVTRTRWQAAGTIVLWARSPAFGFPYLDHDLAFYALGSDNPNADGVGSDLELHLGVDPELIGALFFFFVEGGAADVRLWSSVSYNDGMWHSVIATWDRDRDDARLYVDGQLSAQTGHQASVFDAGSATFLGRPNAQGTRTYHGGLDELRLLDVPVSAEWVATQHRSMSDDLLLFLPDGA